MGLFKCCRSDISAVDEQAHANEIVIAQENTRKGDHFDEDLQAVQWLRDRSLERNFERNFQSTGDGGKDSIVLKPPPVGATMKQQQEFPEIKPQDFIEKTPRRSNKILRADDDVNRKANVLEDSLEKIELTENMRIMSYQEEADEAEREAMHQDQKLEKRRSSRERRRIVEEAQEETQHRHLKRQSSPSRKSNKAATISAAATALKLDSSQRSSSSSPIKRKKKSRSSTTAESSPRSAATIVAAITAARPHRVSLSKERQSRELQLEADLQVDSDVDPVARDQYLIAVQLLHRRIIQKQESLNASEKTFLYNLLHHETDDREDESSLAERLSVIELTLEQRDSSQRLGTSPLTLPETVGGREAVVLPDPFDRASSVPIVPRAEGTIPLDRKSEVSVYSATSTNSGVGVEATLGGQRRRGSSSSRSQKRSNKGEVTRLPLDEELPTLRPDENGDDDDNEEDEIGAPYPILGATLVQPRILKVRLMEALRGFLPYAVSEENFYLKFSLQRDGASLQTLQHKLRGSQYSLMVIQAKDDYQSVFGAFTSSPWRRKESWFGTGQSFLFKQTDKVEVYPFTGTDDLVQYCSSQMLAIGGGDWSVNSPFHMNEKKGIGLLVDGDLQGGETYSCATFCNPKLSHCNEFSILNMEVWTLTPCMTELEAEKLETHKLFVEQNRREGRA